jgi:serine/threonine-protein kinase
VREAATSPDPSRTSRPGDCENSDGQGNLGASMERTAQLVRPACPRCGLGFEPGAARFCTGCGLAVDPAPSAPGGAAPDATGDSAAQAWVGQVVADRYRLLERMAEGGMGQVWKAEHVRMGKALALKLLHERFARDAAAVARFKAEAQIVSRLSHPHTIAVFDFGELPACGFYLAMEYVRGVDLAALLRERGPMPEARAAGLAVQVLGSLAEAHASGVVHRDVKPANVMVMESPEGDFVKVLDFGVAKLRGAETSERVVLGTPSYLAPEQARGADVDGRADLYALGAMLYELVAGRPPFVAPTALAVVAAHVHERPRPLAEVARVTPAFAALVGRALAKRPEDRFPSAEAMRAALLSPAADRGAVAKPAPRPAPRPPPAAPPPRPAGPLCPVAQVEAPGGTLVVPVPPPPSLELASRDDFAAYERSLRRNRLAGPAVALAIVTLGGAVAWRWSALYPAIARAAPRVAAALPLQLRPPDLWDGQEHEPNDTPAHANLLRLEPPPSGGGPGGEGVIWGYVGVGGAGPADVDVYRIEVPPGAPLSLVAEWSAAGDAERGLVGVDVALSLNRDAGPGPAPLVARSDADGAGRARRLSARVDPGTHWLAVREKRAPGAAPGPRAAGPYALRVRLVERAPETEPAGARVARPAGARQHR